jgi:hypothetical protein
LSNQPKIDGSLRNNQIVGKILSRWGQKWWSSDGNKLFKLSFCNYSFTVLYVFLVLNLKNFHNLQSSSDKLALWISRSMKITINERIQNE